MSLRQYPISVLAKQTSKPTMGEWLGQLDSLPSYSPVNANKAVAEAREAEEQELLSVVDRGVVDRSVVGR